MKDGTEYLGEYYPSVNHTEKDIIYFKSQEVLSIQPVSVKLIQKLKLKDGTTMGPSKIVFTGNSQKLINKKKYFQFLKMNWKKI